MPDSDSHLPALVRWSLVAKGLAVVAALAVVITLPMGPLAEHSAALARDVAKVGLGAVHVALARWPAVVAAVAAGLAAGAALSFVPPRQRLIGAAVVAGAIAALVPHGAAAGPALTAALVVLAAQADLARGRHLLAAAPGLGLVWPGALVMALLPSGGARPWVERAALALGVAWAVGLGLAVDLARSPRVYAPGTEHPGAWPAARIDDRVQRLAEAEPGLACEFHDLDLVDGVAVVTAEGSGRLLAFGPDGAPQASHPLPTLWGPMFGVVLDSATDPETGWTWVQTRPDALSTVRLGSDGWQEAGPPVRLPQPEDHAYLEPMDALDQLAFVHVNVSQDRRPPWLTLLDRRKQAPPVVIPLRTADGRPMPMPRDVTWVPPLGKLVLAPDFGDALWTADPRTGLAEPWLRVPTLNGRVAWDAATERLIVPLPQARVLWLVEPVSGRVDRAIPVPLGVRTAAIDAQRGLLVAASVVTGAVTVHDLETGAVRDRFGGLMPMVREVALDEERGVAWLTTWTDLYRFPYVGGLQQP